MLYLTRTCYNCLPEDDPLGSEQLHVGNIVKS